MDLFAPCWDRLARADEHRRALARIWNDYLEHHPYGFGLSHEGNGMHVLEVWEEYPIPTSFSIRLGEWLYNIRACLDYIVWATASYVSGMSPPPHQDALQYPIYESRDAWDRNIYRLRGLADHHREMLFTMQPFNSDADANYLRAINDLARIDRHRRLTNRTAYIAEIEPVVQIPEGASATLQWGSRVLRNGVAQLARIHIAPWQDGMEVQFNPRVGIDPDVGEWAESPFWRRVRFSERLTLIQVFVGAEVAVYEYDCTGGSRKSSALTATYRDQCDARGPYGSPTPAAELPAEWSPPVSAVQSTRERLEGADFPPHGPGSANHRP